jgi:hypothetical protein
MSARVRSRIRRRGRVTGVACISSKPRNGITKLLVVPTVSCPSTLTFRYGCPSAGAAVRMRSNSWANSTKMCKPAQEQSEYRRSLDFTAKHGLSSRVSGLRCILWTEYANLCAKPEATPRIRVLRSCSASPASTWQSRIATGVTDRCGTIRFRIDRYYTNSQWVRF